MQGVRCRVKGVPAKDTAVIDRKCGSRYLCSDLCFTILFFGAGVGVYGVGCRVQGAWLMGDLEFGVRSLELGDWGSGFGFGICGLGFGIHERLGFRVHGAGRGSCLRGWRVR